MYKVDSIPPIKVLINAVITQAANDYRGALKVKDYAGIYECESFFKSHRFMLMTNVDGVYLIDRIRKEVNNEANKFCKGDEKAVCNLSQ